jgi:hypothetical protein
MSIIAKAIIVELILHMRLRRYQEGILFSLSLNLSLQNINYQQMPKKTRIKKTYPRIFSTKHWQNSGIHDKYKRQAEALQSGQDVYENCEMKMDTKFLSHKDRADLKPNQYLMETAKRIPAFNRNISKEHRAWVLERNGYTCQMCGLAAGDLDPFNSSRTVRLTMGHILDKSKGGDDSSTKFKSHLHKL